MAVGPLKHLGKPIELGAEKEYKLEALSYGNKLEHTRPVVFEPKYATGSKTWEELDDRGKAAYILAYKKATGSHPVLQVKPNSDYAAADFEPNDWVEIISKKFDSVAQAKVFLDKYGWGHLHTSFMRGAGGKEQRLQISWARNANLFLFLASLERRSGGQADIWPFAIKGLSVPTEDHLAYYARILAGENLKTTAFSKHTMINLRGGQKYGETGRIGFEARGGSAEEKERVVDSLLVGLTTERWGRVPELWGATEFKLVTVGNDTRQVASLPAEFETRLRQELALYGAGKKGPKPSDAGRLAALVRGARFFDSPMPARLNGFDQRACVPLLNFELLPWVGKGEKGRIMSARREFMAGLAELDDRLKKNPLPPKAVGEAIAGLILRWAKQAQLAEPFGAWLDGDKRVRHFR